MSPALKQVLLKGVYAAGGAFVAAFLPAVQSNDTLFGSFTFVVVAVCTLVEELLPTKTS